MIHRALIVLLFLIVAAVTTSCETTAEREISVPAISDAELDAMEIEFSRYPVPPPQRSIEDIQEIVAEVDISHKSACAGGGFYEVDPPPKGRKTSEKNSNVAYAWRDAANTAFRYGDFDSALGYIDDALRSLPKGWIALRGGITYSRSVYLAVLGDASQSGAYFSRASAAVGNNPARTHQGRRRYEAWGREAAAINAYAQSRYREAEIRLRDLRTGWAGGATYDWTYPSYEEAILPPLRQYAITGDMFVNYLLVLSLVNQNRLVEAEARFNLWQVHDAIDLAWAMDALAVVLLRQGRYADAEWASQRTADFFEEKCAPNHYFVVLRTYLRLAHALAAQGKWEQALPYYGRAYSEHDQDASRSLDRLLLASPDWPIAQMLSGDVAGAHETFSEILSRITLEHGSDSYRAKEVAAFDALNAAISSRSQQAVAVLQDAVTELLEIPSLAWGTTPTSTHVSVACRCWWMSICRCWE